MVSDRALDGRTGSLVLTPLRVAGGAGDGAVLPVARGWVASPDDAVPPPSGEVVLTGFLQSSEAAGALDEGAGTAESISPAQLVNVWGGPIYTGYLVLTTSNPAQEGALALLPAPEARGGGGLNFQNLGYALQWWIFGVFAVGLWVRLVRDEAAGDPEPDAEDASDGTASDTTVRTAPRRRPPRRRDRVGRDRVGRDRVGRRHVAASGSRRAAHLLDRAPPTLRVGATGAGRPARTGRAARCRRGRERVVEQGDQPREGGLAVAQLGAVLGRGDHQHAAGEPRTEPLEHPGAQVLTQGRRRGDVPEQLDARVRGVDGLTARSAGAGEAPLQLVPGHDDAPAQHHRSDHITSLRHTRADAAGLTLW